MTVAAAAATATKKVASGIATKKTAMTGALKTISSAGT